MEILLLVVFIVVVLSLFTRPAPRPTIIIVPFEPTPPAAQPGGCLRALAFVVLLVALLAIVGILPI